MKKKYTHTHPYELNAILKMKKECIDTQRDKSRKYNDWAERALIYNTTTGEFLKLPDYDDRRAYRGYYVSDQFNVFHNFQIDKGLIPVFVTLTKSSKNSILYEITPDNPFCPTSLFDMKTPPKVYDNSFETMNYYERNIISHNKALEQTHRLIYKNFRPLGNEHFKVPFISVTEPHKSLFPHQHNIYYLPAEFVDKFILHINRIEDKYFVNSHKDEKRIKVLDSSKFSIIYLLKYINKSLTSDSVIDNHLDGWYKKFKIRQYRTSRGEIKFNLKLYSQYIRLIDWKHDNIISGIKKIKIDYIDDEKLIDYGAKNTIYVLRSITKIPKYYLPEKSRILSNGEVEIKLHWFPEVLVKKNKIITPSLNNYEYKILTS